MKLFISERSILVSYFILGERLVALISSQVTILKLLIFCENLKSVTELAADIVPRFQAKATASVTLWGLLRRWKLD